MHRDLPGRFHSSGKKIPKLKTTFIRVVEMIYIKEKLRIIFFSFPLYCEIAHQKVDLRTITLGVPPQEVFVLLT